MNYQIKSWLDGKVLFEGEFGSLKLCVEAAVKADANLAGANLAGAYLAGADLDGANLDGANLDGADLADANLAGANLAGAYLAGADLAGANLVRASLAGAYLAGANLVRANLARANLAGANLAGANLVRANLAGANLDGADLAGAYLDGADLADANLAGANLAGAYLARAKSLPVPSAEEIARLDQVREIVLAKPERLKMNSWHSGNWTPDHTPEEEHSCGSAHCIAGWLQALSPDKKIREMSAESAGYTLAPASSFMFYQTDDVALEWLKNRDYAKLAEQVKA